MTSIKINNETSVTQVQEKLRSFGRFSEVEIVFKKEKEELKLREVGLGERIIRQLRRMIFGSSPEEANFMLLRTLKEVNGDVCQFLTDHVKKERKIWKRDDLLLKTANSKLPEVAQATKEFTMPYDPTVSNGDHEWLLDARAEAIEAERIVRWKVCSGFSKEWHISTAPDAANKRVKSAEIREGATAEEMREAYAEQLKNPQESVVITPIPDCITVGPDTTIDSIDSNSFTYESLNCLLDAIDAAFEKEPEREPITIATDWIDDLADRIKRLKLEREADRQKPSDAMKVKPGKPSVKETRWP